MSDPAAKLRSTCLAIVETARPTCAAANHMIVHMQFIQELRDALNLAPHEDFETGADMLASLSASRRDSDGR